jgi:hypothetical protein
MLRKVLIIIMGVMFVSNAYAGGIDFRMGSKTAELVYLTESATFGYGGADMGFGAFINENDDLMASGSVLVSGSGEGDVRGLHFGVGAKVYLGILDFPSPLDNQEGAALSIGAQVRYVFPSKMPFAILLEGFGAPGVTSASDFEGLKEFRGAIELEVTPSARAYIGYRKLEVELNSGIKRELDDKVHAGVRFSF